MINNQIRDQRMHLFLGFQYTVDLNATEWHHNCPPQEWVHRLTVTWAISSGYHVFSHTFYSPHFSASHSSILEPRVVGEVTSCAENDKFCEQDLSQSVCAQKDSLYSVSMSKETVLMAASCGAFHKRECFERRSLGAQCSAAAEWTLTNEPCFCKWGRCALHSDHQSLRVATYNLWNLNSLEVESYTSRLTRLAKVCPVERLRLTYRV